MLLLFLFVLFSNCTFLRLIKGKATTFIFDCPACLISNQILNFKKGGQLKRMRMNP
jgi:hypothetical protein